MEEDALVSSLWRGRLSIACQGLGGGARGRGFDGVCGGGDMRRPCSGSLLDVGRDGVRALARGDAGEGGTPGDIAVSSKGCGELDMRMGVASASSAGDSAAMDASVVATITLVSTRIVLLAVVAGVEPQEG